MDDDIPYLLLTPGPLTTSKSVRQAMMQDYCTWDDDYNAIVTDIRTRLVDLATDTDEFTSILMQGSGTFAIESTLGTVVPNDGKVLVVNNGAYGERMVQICQRLKINTIVVTLPESEPANLELIEKRLLEGGTTHLAMVHCETTTGLLNPISEVGKLTNKYSVSYIIDAMSSFGGIPMSMGQLHADYLISSANKCIQGVPGFAFVIAKRAKLEQCVDQARSLSLDLFDQWHEMESNSGKWRYTSPTHVVRACAQALHELEREGGVAARYQRYKTNQQILTSGLMDLGLLPLIKPEYQSPVITAFLYPDKKSFSFQQLYDSLKERRFVIYPGKVSQADTFRVGTIGHVFSRRRSLVGSML